jgi:fumarate reductase flavoprotein subunit
MDVFDIVVVGAGGSGLCAAISAASQGVSVIVLEKNAHPGGSTAMSVGSFSAARTRIQARAGVNDSPSAFLHDMAAANGELHDRDNKELSRILALDAGPTLEWLVSLGVQFFGPMPEPPFKNPRMHNVVPHSGGYITALAREARKRNIVIRTGFRVDRLMTASDGSVTGVAAGFTEIRARKAVILATGDYSANQEMKAEYVSEQTAGLPPVNPGSTGDGFRLAGSVGATFIHMWRAMEELRFAPREGAFSLRSLPTGRFASSVMRRAVTILPRWALGFVVRAAMTGSIGPSPAIYASGAIIVDSEGHRFANEESPSEVARALGGLTKNEAYIIFDRRVADLYSGPPHPIGTFPGIAYAYLRDYERFRSDIVRHAGTLAELAPKCSLPPDALAKTVAAWNDAIAGDLPDPYGRASRGEGIRTAEYWAIGPVKGVVTITDGGLKVNDRLQVLNESGAPISGLFAAGSTGQGGLILRNHGMHIGWAMTSGRLVGRYAVIDGRAAD